MKMEEGLWFTNTQQMQAVYKNFYFYFTITLKAESLALYFLFQNDPYVLHSSEGIAEGVSTLTVIMDLSSSEGAPF